MTASVYNFDAIEAAHERLGYTLGWRFLMCAEERVAGAKLLITTLNPAGSERHGPPWSYEAGNAYETEIWAPHAAGEAKLQRQIQRLVSFLGLSFDEVAAAYLVPFRSPRWDGPTGLGRKSEALEFAKQLWSEFLPKIKPQMVVCVGRDVGRFLAPLMGVLNLRLLDTGWGSVKLDRGELLDGAPFISLPHLSTFQLFGPSEIGLNKRDRDLRAAFFGAPDAGPEQQKWASHA